jgi:hypothetical protein
LASRIGKVETVESIVVISDNIQREGAKDAKRTPRKPAGHRDLAGSASRLRMKIGPSNFRIPS